MKNKPLNPLFWFFFFLFIPLCFIRSEKVFSQYGSTWKVVYRQEGAAVDQCQIIGTGVGSVAVDQKKTSQQGRFYVTYSKQSAPSYSFSYEPPYRPLSGTHITFSFGGHVFILQVPSDFVIGKALNTYNQDFIQRLVESSKENQLLVVSGTSKTGEIKEERFSLIDFPSAVRGLRRICAIPSGGKGGHTSLMSLNQDIPAFSGKRRSPKREKQISYTVDVQGILDRMTFDVARTKWVPERKK